MIAHSTTHSAEIVVLRCPHDVVFRAATDTWKGFRSSIERLCADGKDLVISVQDSGAKGITKFPPLTALVIRRTQGPLRQLLNQATVVIEGGCENLLALAENIDCSNPVEGAHFHSDEWTPGVLQGSISLVFAHATNAHAL